MNDGRQRSDGRINVLGWLMSYADMATVLLAMFIVLSTLSRDQTGVSLYNGTRSLANATSSLGLLERSSTAALPPNKPTPSYLCHPSEPDEEDEDERLHQFLEELRRQFPLESQRGQPNRIVVDLYETLHKEAPRVGVRTREVFSQLRPLLEREDSRLYLIVWTPTPSPSAWRRSAAQARQAAEELAATGNLPSRVAVRLVPLAQPWRYRDIRRPILSFLVTKAAD